MEIGQLAVARAFGDHELKEWVVSTPYLSENELKEEDSHIIIACDGVKDT
jgi:serine/threonine protein phosphatase PrpC